MFELFFALSFQPDSWCYERVIGPVSGNHGSGGGRLVRGLFLFGAVLVIPVSPGARLHVVCCVDPRCLRPICVSLWFLLLRVCAWPICCLLFWCSRLDLNAHRCIHAWFGASLGPCCSRRGVPVTLLPCHRAIRVCVSGSAVVADSRQRCFLHPCAGSDIGGVGATLRCPARHASHIRGCTGLRVSIPNLSGLWVRLSCDAGPPVGPIPSMVPVGFLSLLTVLVFVCYCVFPGWWFCSPGVFSRWGSQLCCAIWL